jgi:hypothetical protein
VSIASRVVPGMSCTTERSSPTSRLNSVDLPTFGRPTIATEKMPSSLGRRRRAGTSSARSSGSAATSASSSSPDSRPWIADTAHGSPRPSRMNSPWMSTSRARRRPCWRRRSRAPPALQQRATRASSSVMPVVTSTTKQHDVGVAHRGLGLRGDLRRERGRLGGEPASPGRSQPPVSTSTNARPFHSATSSRRSRVTPGRSSTIAARWPTMRFTSDDLPTLGRPTTATRGMTRVSITMYPA